ncbi:hypothetical protein EB001_04805 [bacterium]|nr:hypothetical protein [bacterium]
MLEIIKHVSVGVGLIALFIIGYIAKNTELYITVWLVSGVYGLTIGTGGFWKIFKNDPNTLLGCLNIFGRLILIIGCLISGILALIIMIFVELIDYAQEIEED